MKSLVLKLLYGRVAGICHSRGIRIDTILLARGGKPNRRLPYEPGIKHKELALQEDFSDIEHEAELNEVPDFINIDQSYDSHYREIKNDRKKLSYIITSKKFFKLRAEPLTLTCNDRQCIRYLHQQDPVLWNIKTLSESFPATTQTIKKILKQKWKITPEKAKALDERVARTWELLKEGKLDADPHVLQHLKKFLNRQPILLDQIKNEKFYLPEVKKEPVWNNGEFSGILAKYERIIKDLRNETSDGQNPKMLEDGKSQDKEEKSSVDIVHEKIKEEISTKRLENKDTFLFRELAKYPENPKTLYELENQILRKAEARGELTITEKAILEKKLGVISEEQLNKVTESVSVSSDKVIKKQKHLKKKEKDLVGNNKKNKTYLNENDAHLDSKMELRRTSAVKDDTHMENYLPLDGKTKLGSECEVGKLLRSIKNLTQIEPEEPKEIKISKKIEFSNPEKLERENKHYDKEVMSVKGTAFWNDGRTSKDKALAESEKYPHEGPAMTEPGVNVAKTAILSSEHYPERIKIPKHQQGSGLTFRIKDCYYDDDGQFLYRVPGMTK